MNVEEKIKKMENCRGKNHDLKEFRQWIDLCLPEHKDLKKIQVAGTNGKGSTSIWLRDLLMKKGYRVGVFTSPHLVSHTERIRINEQCIPLKEWERIYDTYSNLFDAHTMTMFEMDLWMAIAYFIEQKVDYCIIEAGMGGRLDATTSLDYLVTIITNIGLDHTEYLGDTLEKIAYEKAGIFKTGVPALTTETNLGCRNVLKQVADEVGSPISFVEVKKENPFQMKPPYYQISNLALALETLKTLGLTYTNVEIQSVIDHFVWDGRFMIIRKDPLVLLDGAHNPHGIKALVQSLPDFKGKIYFSVLKEKDAQHMIELLKTISTDITLVEISSYRLYPLKQLGYPIITIPQLMEELKTTTSPSLLCGSIYFVGEILENMSI